MIAFVCGNCGQQLKVEARLAGQIARCPHCRQRTSIPGADGAPTLPPRLPSTQGPDGTPTLPPRVPSKERQGGSQPSPAELLPDHAKKTTPFANADPIADGEPAARPEAVSVPGYEILSELGRGGMGVVYKARQRTPRRLVALKMILAGSHATETELGRFRAEAEAIARLQHPNIVQVYEVGEHRGLPFFSLEFCAGGSMASGLDGTPLSPVRAAGVVETLGQAMHAAHRQKLIHRDLKPANVLLAAGGVLKITDFGLAKRLGEEAGRTQTGAIMGTPSYMAPEQAEGKAVGPAADIYALGAILYELLTGRPPFKADTPLNTLMQVVSDEPVPPSQLQPRIPRDVETVCLKCLHKEPGKRYPSAQALADDLHRFQEGLPVSARPAGPLERSWRWCRRNPLVAGLLLTTALTLIGGIISTSYWAVEATENARLADLKAGEASESARKEAEAARVADEKAREATEALRKEAEAHRVANQKTREVLRLYATQSLDQAISLLEQGENARGMLGLAHALQVTPDDEEDLRQLIRTNLAAWYPQLSPLREMERLTYFPAVERRH
jgi:serine/threonine protein kinase